VSLRKIPALVMTHKKTAKIVTIATRVVGRVLKKRAVLMTKVAPDKIVMIKVDLGRKAADLAANRKRAQKILNTVLRKQKRRAKNRKNSCTHLLLTKLQLTVCAMCFRTWTIYRIQLSRLLLNTHL
jgi:hypothetical protein